MTGKESEDALVKRTVGSTTGRIAQREGKLYQEVYTHEYTLTWSGQLRTTKMGWKVLEELPDDANIIED
jgi:hypothetical protein|tara:strand:- start:255 stop:461 length:207 start_codon:yes stop_codon:yes gene_type:complete